jgi:hypothetical protein
MAAGVGSDDRAAGGALTEVEDDGMGLNTTGLGEAT